MSVYAIGDIQGCYAEFRRLLDLIAFEPGQDRLWLVGDLVNRGPESLSVLRTVRELGDSAVTVLGNHDFHLLTVAAGHRRAHADDTLGGILDAPDRDELLAWLRARPLVVLEDDWLLVHAGLLPSWTPATAVMLSREVETMLGSDRHDDFLASSVRRPAGALGRNAARLRPPASHRERVHAPALLLRGRHDGAW